jgi:hypothetical protein
MMRRVITGDLRRRFDPDETEAFQFPKGAPFLIARYTSLSQRDVREPNWAAVRFPMVEEEVKRYAVCARVASRLQAIDPRPGKFNELLMALFRFCGNWTWRSSGHVW